MLRVTLLVALGALVCADPIIRALPELQLVSGGFHEIGTDAADIDATSSALFLASLYGQTTQINTDDAAQYVSSLRSSSDHGYGFSSGMPSSLEATRLALESYLHLGKEIPEASQVGDYIRSLFNVNNGLFASQSGGDGDLKSTAIAVEALSILGELQKPVVQEMLKRVKDLLQERVVSSGDTQHFVLDPESTTPVSDNYYGIALAVRSDFNFSDRSAWARYLLQLQDLDELSATRGGFFASEARSAVTAEATAHAARSFKLLGIDIEDRAEALFQYVQNRKYSVKETAFSHYALAHTSLFKSLFQIRVFYDPVDKGTGQFVQGMQVTPVVRVTVFDGTVVHGGFHISATESKGYSAKLPFELNHNLYVASSELDTSDRLGDVEFSFKISSVVYPLGDIQFAHEDSKRIGFRVTVEDSATLEGQIVDATESVSSGTEFDFKITLGTETEDDIENGDFDLVFSVKDASGVVQHSHTLDGNTNNKEIEFKYTLTGEDFPAGVVQFVFEVRNDEGVHTSQSVVRSFNQQMVATKVSVSKSYQLGSTLSVTMEPGSIKESNSVSTFSKSNAAQRSFVMDVVSSQGTTVLSVPGVVIDSSSNAAYKFDTELPVSLDVVGENALSFRFVPAKAEFASNAVKLLPYDTSANELYEDAGVHSFNVDAELHLHEVEAEPKATQFTYGSSIPLKFKIKDTLSGLSLVAGEQSQVFVALKSRSQNFESSRVIARPQNNVFEVSVAIDANAIAGDASIVVSAVSVDETEVPVYAQGSKSPAKYDINIGGSIDVSKSTFSTSTVDATKTALVVTFSLTCAEKPLSNARLFADVLVKGSTGYTPLQHNASPVERVAVARDASSSTSGTSHYSLSVVVPHEAATTGEYKIVFRRGVDLEQAKSDASQVAPLFEIALEHKQVEDAGFVIRMEFVTILVLISLFLGVKSHAALFDIKKRA